MLKIAYHSCYHHDLPEGHRFPMEKYSLIPAQLLHEGTIEQENLFSPNMNDLNKVLRVHAPEYLQRLQHGDIDRQEARRIGFPYSQALLEREICITNGTVACADFALEHGIAMNVAGGTHHAFYDKGEGFCIFNDIAVAAQYLLDQQKARQILVVDLDVHQGNGTASIFSGNDAVFTFSMHGEKNFPFKKENSDLDIGLPDGIDDKSYLRILEKELDTLVTRLEPDMIFYQSGVDVLATDRLGKLRLSREGCKRRDELVMQTARQGGIPIVAVMGGGYSVDIRHIIEAHCNTYRLAQEIWF